MSQHGSAIVRDWDWVYRPRRATASGRPRNSPTPAPGESGWLIRPTIRTQVRRERITPKEKFWALALGSVGVVFGDIGTSPLYAMREALTHGRRRRQRRTGGAGRRVADHLGADPDRHGQVRRLPDARRQQGRRRHPGADGARPAGQPGRPIHPDPVPRRAWRGPKSLTAVQRLLRGAGVDQMEILVNGDYHEFHFSGIAKDLLDSASFEAGTAQLQSFPEEPPVAAFDYSIVPGHMGQAWLGTGPSRFCTITAATIQ